MADLDITETDRIKHEKIEKAKKFEDNVNDAIGIAAELKEDIQKIREDICEGPDCLKKKVEDKFEFIEEKIKNIEEKTAEFLCDNCGYNGVKALSSFCPNCGHPIYEWKDDSDSPIAGWKHYSERKK